MCVELIDEHSTVIRAFACSNGILFRSCICLGKASAGRVYMKQKHSRCVLWFSTQGLRSYRQWLGRIRTDICVMQMFLKWTKIIFHIQQIKVKKESTSQDRAFALSKNSDRFVFFWDFGTALVSVVICADVVVAAAESWIKLRTARDKSDFWRD